MKIVKDIEELLKAEVITKEVATKIQQYYKNKNKTSTTNIFVVFGILGAILIGLGIILIIAHNWDNFSKTIKTSFSFILLLIAQILCFFAITKKQNSTVWKESTATFLFFVVGASISLISQIYNIPGDFNSFLLTWLLLCFPLIYIMKSSAVSLLYIIGITFYTCKLGYWTHPSLKPYLYWGLLLISLPHYYFLYQKKGQSNFMIFHNWLIPISLTIVLGTMSENTEELMFIAYLSLFGLFYLIGRKTFFIRQKIINNAYKIIGSLGTVILLLYLSSNGFWKYLKNKNLELSYIVTTPEFFISAIISAIAIVFGYKHYKNKSLKTIKPLSVVFILFIITFVVGLFSSISVVLINIYILVIGILTIREGAKKEHLGILNFGLLLITALIVYRFFDAELSFVLRGVLFILIGIGFFMANYRMLKKRNTNE